MMNSGKFLNKYPQDYKKGFRLAVCNENRQEEELTVRWQIRQASAAILRQDSCQIRVDPYSTTWLPYVETKDLAIFDEYVSYAVYRDEEELSCGTVNLSYPKYFHYEDPQLSATVNGDTITVTAAAYAKSVEIRNENEDLVLSDNYFDMNAGSRSVKILSGDPAGLRLRSVYDIR